MLRHGAWVPINPVIRFTGAVVIGARERAPDLLPSPLWDSSAKSAGLIGSEDGGCC